MATVTFDNATRIYPGTDKPAVDKLNLEIADGEFLVLVGPSGCGKSTSLRMLAGLEEVNAGRILIGDRDVTDVPPKDRDIAMVFQNYALYPHMTVADNMGFALKIAGVDKDEIAPSASRRPRSSSTSSSTSTASRRPSPVASVSASPWAAPSCVSPQVFLMDEPLSNLDAKLRVQTRTQIASLQRRLGVTTVYVTHDQVEAMTMGDRVAVLKDGLLQQVDTPRDLYDRPNNVFVAGFIGSPAMNLLEAAGHRRRRQVRRRASYPVDARAPRPSAGKHGHRRRPSRGPRPSPTDGEGLPVTVDLVEELGADAYIYGHTDVDGKRTDIVARVDGRTPPARRRQRVTSSPDRRPRAPVRHRDRRAPRRLSRSTSTRQVAVPDRRGAATSAVRSLTAGSDGRPVAADRHGRSAGAQCHDGPMALEHHRAPADPALLDLPWRRRSRSGRQSHLAALPRGISRHIVRFATCRARVIAVKEITERHGPARVRHARKLRRLDVPCVEPVGVITGRPTADGEPLDAVPGHPAPQFSLPYRALFSPDAAPRHRHPAVDALAVLLVRLHLVGFYWGDVSLSNTLFRRDAGAFAAYLVDAETGELHATAVRRPARARPRHRPGQHRRRADGPRRPAASSRTKRRPGRRSPTAHRRPLPLAVDAS